jgi:hypothetical protein
VRRPELKLGPGLRPDQIRHPLGGNNDYHGSSMIFIETPSLNSNYWFNNRDLPPDPKTGEALAIE